jgi:sodium transport system ATP-binding protein
MAAAPADRRNRNIADRHPEDRPFHLCSLHSLSKRKLMIRVSNLTKKFTLDKRKQKELATSSSSVTAVDDISFECSPGRVHALLGPNGAGKTTTLRMLSTIFSPSAGTIEIDGIDAVSDPRQARRRIGFLTGSAGLYARLTPDELVTYFGKLYGVPAQELEARKKKLYDLLDIHEFRDKRIGKLSTGMKQRVSICRTMIHDPQVVIFDEPTSGLDVITAENIIRLIRDCREQGKTVIFSSHIMSEVDLLCDDITIIHRGKVLYNDTMQAFRDQMQAPNLTAEFIRIVNETKTTKL